MKKILLINPVSKNVMADYIENLKMPPISLTLLAALTPSSYEVAIIDERVQTVDLNEKVDLVGITAMTFQAPRAYEIAAEFRSRGVPVIIGGIHASAVPEEAAQHVDAVVVGEAEEIWETVLDDFAQGSLKNTYVGPPADITHLPRPRWDLLSDKLPVRTVQTSRGCPFNCSFCSVTSFFGGSYRMRPVEDVLDEIRAIDSKQFSFVDDNIIGSGRKCTERSLRLFDGLKELNKRWGSQCCVNIAENEDLLRAAADSGAVVLFLGFESIETDTLKSMNKRVNMMSKTQNYKEVIKKIHAHGIAIVGSFIIGWDEDTPETFDRLSDFINEVDLDCSQFLILTPFPGTQIYHKLKDEGRIKYTNFPEDWLRYTNCEAVIEPKHMTLAQLEDAQERLFREFGRPGMALRRAAKTLWTTKSVLYTSGIFSWNYAGYRFARDIGRQRARDRRLSGSSSALARDARCHEAV